MDKYVCDACGYVYDPAVGDPDHGIAPGTPFEELFARSGRNWAHVPRDWDAPCRINFFNLRTGRAFSAGHIDPEPMVRDLLG